MNKESMPAQNLEVNSMDCNVIDEVKLQKKYLYTLNLLNEMESPYPFLNIVLDSQ